MKQEPFRLPTHFGKARTCLGVAILIALCAHSLFLTITRSCVYNDACPKDIVALFEHRMSELKKMVGPKDTIGYFSNVVPDEMDRERPMDYVITQYVLAPALIVNSTDATLVLGNFFGSESMDAAYETIQRNRLHPLRDFGEGVVLFRRESD